jgi:UDP-N-acetylglucosamine 2-epimerase
VIEALCRKNWKVRILRFDRVWEKAEQFLSKTTKRRSLESFYEKPKPTIPNKTKSWFYDILARIIFRAVNLIRLERPSIIIVMTDSTPPCRVAVLVGKLARMPSLLLLHSGMVGRNYECPNFIVDKIAVTGEFARRTLIACGVEEDKIVVTGRPSYDELVKALKHFNRDDICRRLGLDPNKKIIVYTTENLPPRENERTTRVICRTVKEFSGVEFIIKVHPSELDLSVYKNVTAELGLKALITRQASIYEVLYVCDVVITGFSATALDAMVLHRPVITVNLTALEDPLPFAESGAAIGVYEQKDLGSALEKGLYDETSRESMEKERAKFVYQQVYMLDGEATTRVVQLIQQMVSLRYGRTGAYNVG